MLTSPDYESISFIPPTKFTASYTEREPQTQAVQEPQYDSVSLSSQTEEGRFRKELVSRLSQEVRTATSTGDIRQLKQAVEDGTYQPDPMRIASKILFLDEEEP